MQKIKSGKDMKVYVHIAVIVGLVAFFSYFVFSNLANIYSIRSEISAVNQKIADEASETDKIKQEAEEMNSDAYYEKILREKGYIKSDEIIFIKK